MANLVRFLGLRIRGVMSSDLFRFIFLGSYLGLDRDKMNRQHVVPVYCNKIHLQRDYRWSSPLSLTAKEGLQGVLTQVIAQK